jgi:hypothetical protein
MQHSYKVTRASFISFRTSCMEFCASRAWCAPCMHVGRAPPWLCADIQIVFWCCPLQSWSAAGALVDVPVAVQMTVTNTTMGNRLPIRLSATVGCYGAGMAECQLQQVWFVVTS